MPSRETAQPPRAAPRMPREQPAMLLGVSRQSVTKWESGKSNPEMDKLLKICEIFGCTLDDLVCGNLTSRPAEPTVAMPDAAPADVCGYDEERRSFARSVSTAVACFILGPACSALLESLGRLADIDHRLVDVLGVLPVLGLVAAGVALVVPAGIRHSAFVRSHPFVEDFYTEEDRAACRTLLTRRLVAGIALILLGVAVCVVVDQYLCLEDLAGGLMLCLVAVGVRFIVLGGMLWGGMDVGAYNSANAGAEADGALGPRSRRDRVTGGLCGAVMLVATLVGLVMLFVPGYQTPLFWLAWPIGGITCGVVSCLTSAFVADE